MTPSGREMDNNEVSCYLAGVPVKVSERYRPPRRVVLPVGFQKRLETNVENALRDSHYDFTLCRNVIDNARMVRDQRAANRESRKARLAAEDERRKADREKQLADQIEKFSISAEVQETAKTNVEDDLVLPPSPSDPPAPLPTTQASGLSAILTPQPMPVPAKLASPINPKSAFNISDFEADTSSPFDNMELKTINEMEELAHVLQPNCASDTQPKDNYQYSNYYSQSDVPGNNMLNSSKPVNYGAYGTVQSSSSVVNRPNYGSSQQTYAYPNQQQQPASYYYPSQQQPWMYSEPSRAYPAYVPSQYSAQSTCSSAYPFSSAAAPTYSQVSVGYTATLNSSPTPVLSSSLDQNLRNRTSKSVPDILEELQQEAARSRAVAVPKADPLPSHHLPTTRPASFGSTGLENWKPWPELDSPQDAAAPPPVVVTASPDLLVTLSPGAQQMARQLAEMGFPLARVARACHTLGEDHKKVLDLLLQVQALEEKGFPGSRVELALCKLGLDEPQALRFLPALGQLVDLGFEEERAAQALLSAECDRDRALDALLA